MGATSRRPARRPASVPRAGGHDQPRGATAEATRLRVDLDRGAHVPESSEPGVPAHRMK